MFINIMSIVGKLVIKIMNNEWMNGLNGFKDKSNVGMNN